MRPHLADHGDDRDRIGGRDDGSEQEIHAGDAVAIPPGHDAEVIGDETFVMVDFGEIGDYAKRD